MRSALRLAFLLLAVALVTGCQHAAVKIATPRKVKVRMATLLPLHPAWRDVTLLERCEERLVIAAQSPTSLRWTETSVPVPFSGPGPIPEGLSKVRDQRALQDARNYLAQVTEALHQRAQLQYQREEAAEQKKLQARIAADSARREAELRAANAHEAHWIDLDLRNLGFRDVALQSQVRAYTGLALKDAQEQRTKVLARVEDLTHQKEALLSADVRTQVAVDMKPVQERMTAEMRTHLQQRLAELNAGVEQRVQRRRDRINIETAPIPPLAVTSLPPEDTHTLPLALATDVSSSRDVASGMASAGAQMAAALGERRSLWESRKAHLVAAIGRDIDRSVGQMARKNGWRVAPASDPAATDMTGQVARALQSEWKQGAL